MTALLTGNLPLLASAPNGIKKLRELILELAVRGKLVPQDANDEPASELLKRITQEKARLVVEGGIKKQQPLAEIGEEEKPFELPEKWTWVRLADLAYPQAGFAFKSVGFNASGLGLPLIRIRDVGQEFSGTFYQGEYRSEFVVESGDHLISMDGQFRVATWQGDAALLNQRVSRLIFFGNESSRRFVANSLQARLLELQGVKAYTTVDHLSGGQISESIIALPPVAEQYRIVAKVDELMALCDRLEARQADADSAHAQLVRALLDSLTQARDAEDFAQSWQRLTEHFHTLFTTESSIDALKQALLQLAVMGKLVSQNPDDEPAVTYYQQLLDLPKGCVRSGKQSIKDKVLLLEKDLPIIPESWIYRSVDQLYKSRHIVDYADGNHGSFYPRKEDFSGEGVVFLTAAQIGADGSISWDDCPRLSPAKAGKLTKGWSRIGDVFYTHNATVGRTAISREGPHDEFLLGTSVTFYRVNDGAISPSFLYWYFSSPSWSDQAQLVMRQTTRNQVSITKQALFFVALPPRAEQHRIVTKIEKLMALCDQLKARLGEAAQVHEQLSNAFVGQALNGEGKSGAEVVDFSAYLISKLASQRTFGRVAHMKLLFLADSHLSLGLMDGYRRHAAGPLDTSIYRVEELAAQKGLYSTSIEMLKSGQEKVFYHIGANINRSADVAAAALGSARKELDRLIALFEGRKTDDLEAVATLYAVWNDALVEGLHPNDEWLINEFRSNWHEAKERFAPEILGKWLAWMRDNGLVPAGNGAVTKSQAAFLFN